VHPDQVAASRPRFTAAGGKSDNFDAFVLAELARTDSHRFRVLVADTDATKALRALTRAREDLVETRVAVANSLKPRSTDVAGVRQSACAGARRERRRCGRLTPAGALAAFCGGRDARVAVCWRARAS
jgi:hypothetical protein